MFKKLSVIVLITSLSVGVFAQKKGSSTTTSSSGFEKSMFDLKKDAYEYALQNYDNGSAIVHLQDIIALGHTNYEDTLALVYHYSGQTVNAMVLSEKLIENKADDPVLMEIIASSRRSLGDSKTALEKYEKLYSLKQDVAYAYEIATIQYELKRMAECIQTINAIIANPASEQEKTVMNYGQGATQEISFKAAALNIAGVVYLELNKPTEAEQALNAALQLEPDFALAKNNLAVLQNPEGNK